VADTGIGMPRDSLSRVFDRFHRVEGARGRSHEGSGIGLALVQELVRMHGGSIAVDSAPGRGSVFTVEIPSGNGHLPSERLLPARDDARATARADTYVAEALGWLPGAPATAPCRAARYRGARPHSR
jgi:hypothetical protein